MPICLLHGERGSKLLRHYYANKLLCVFFCVFEIINKSNTCNIEWASQHWFFFKLTFQPFGCVWVFPQIKCTLIVHFRLDIVHNQDWTKVSRIAPFIIHGMEVDGDVTIIIFRITRQCLEESPVFCLFSLCNFGVLFVHFIHDWIFKCCIFTENIFFFLLNYKYLLSDI